MGTIFNIQKFCVHDGDGIRTCVFFKGCPLRCVWCHNPEGLDAHPQLAFKQEKCTACGRCVRSECGARRIQDGKLEIDRKSCTACGKCAESCLSDACEILGYEASAEEVFTQVLQDKMFYDSTGGGVTLSGGEPSMQAEFALEILQMAKDAQIGRAVETCGIGSRDFYKKAADLNCTFLYDLKCMNGEKHKRLTGVDNDRIIANLLYLFERKADVIIRMPLVPGVNDDEEDLDALCAFLKEHEGKYRYCEIMPYHTLGNGKAKRLGSSQTLEKEAADENDIAGWTQRFSQNGVSVRTSKE